jgi:hypothetical protein
MGSRGKNEDKINTASRLWCEQNRIILNSRW